MVLGQPGSYVYCLQGFYEKKNTRYCFRDFFSVCISKSIHSEIEWIPRAENGLADYHSRIEDYDDHCGIYFHLLNLIQKRFGTFSIDLFASDHNAKVKRYFSRFWNRSCL